MRYTFKAVVLDINDGDTFKASIRLRRTRARDADLGFHFHVERGWLVLHTNIRIHGLNCNESGTPAGDAAERYVREHMPPGSVITLETIKFDGDPDKYGNRWLGRNIVIPDGRVLNDILVKYGHAKAWDGKGVKPV